MVAAFQRIQFGLHTIEYSFAINSLTKPKRLQALGMLDIVNVDVQAAQSNRNPLSPSIGNTYVMSQPFLPKSKTSVPA